MINLDNIKPTTTSAVSVCVLTFFCIELMIFLLHESLFMRLDLVRLASIGIGISAPILMMNGFIAVVIRKSGSKEELDNEEKEKLSWSLSGGVSILLVSFICLIGYTYHFSLYKSLWVLFWIQCALVFLAILKILGKRSRR
jgi:hypothetical protein